MQPRCGTGFPQPSRGSRARHTASPVFAAPSPHPGTTSPTAIASRSYRQADRHDPGQSAQDAAPPDGYRRYCSSAGRDLHSPPALGLPLHRLPDRVLFETAYGAVPGPPRWTGCISRISTSTPTTSTSASTAQVDPAPWPRCCWVTAATWPCPSWTGPGPAPRRFAIWGAHQRAGDRCLTRCGVAGRHRHELRSRGWMFGTGQGGVQAAPTPASARGTVAAGG
jgi:hypothetical protein